MTAALAFPPARKKFARSDLGNAERFVARHGDDVRWVPAWKRWLLWDGARWKTDDTLGIKRLAKETVRSIYDETAAADSAEARKDLVTWAMRSEAANKLDALLDVAKAEPTIAITAATLDADPWLLCVANGTLDLRSATLRPHSRGDLITKVVPAAYDPDAPRTRWEAFLSRVLAGDEELIRFIQRAVGYSLTGLTSERALFFLHGHGANGKSTFLEILRQLLAGYASQADFTTFLDRKGDGPRNDIARLFSARVVTSSEVGEGKRLDESLVKTLTGDETVTARFLHAEFFEFQPTFKLWLAANHKPVIRGTDNAIWDRVKLVPFTVSIPIGERDAGLRDALLAELPGILAWAVGGAVMWCEKTLGAPAAVAMATEQYRRDSDTLGAFLEDCCEVGTTALHAEQATRLYKAYEAWCKEGGEFQMPQRRFGMALEERGITKETRGRDRARLVWRTGIRLLSEAPSSPAPRATPASDAERTQGGLEI